VFWDRHLLGAKLRPANVDAAAGSVEEVARIVAQVCSMTTMKRARSSPKSARRYKRHNLRQRAAESVVGQFARNLRIQGDPKPIRRGRGGRSLGSPGRDAMQG
jgi:hypothetical protein